MEDTKKNTSLEKCEPQELMKVECTDTEGPKALPNEEKVTAGCEEYLAKKIPAAGVICAAISGICVVIMRLPVKLLVDINPLQVVSNASIVTLIVVLAVVLFKGHSLMGIKGERLLLWIRVATGVAANFLLFYSTKFIPLGDTSTVLGTEPIFVGILARILLGESCSVFNGIVTVFVAISVVLIARPDFLFASSNEADQVDSSYVIWGVLCALGAAIFRSFGGIANRKLIKTPTSVILFTLATCNILAGLAFTAIVDRLKMPSWDFEVPLLIASGATFLCAICLITVALKLEKAGPVALATNSDIIFAFLVQVIFFKEIPVWTSYLGAVMMLICVVSIGLRSWYIDSAESFLWISNFRSYCWKKLCMRKSQAKTVTSE